MALTGQSTKVEIINLLTSTAGLVTAQASLNKAYTIASWTDGTGANQANMVYSATRTLTASATEDLDLAGGLTNAFGATITFTRIKVLCIAAAAANTNNVQVGGASSNAFVNWVANANDIVNVMPGGILFVASPNATGYAVTAGTGDLLHVANSGAGTAVTYDIILIGTV